MAKTLTFINGKFFPRSARGAGMFFIGISFIVLFLNFIVSLILCSLGVIIVSTDYGIVLDIEHKKFCDFTRVLGVRMGKWKSFEQYVNISILKINQSEESYLLGGAAPLVNKEYFFDIYFLNKSQRKRHLICRFKSQSEAMERGKDLSTVLNMKIIDYNPSRNKKYS